MLALVFTKEDLACLEGDDRSTMHFYRSLLHRCPPRNFKMCRKHQLGLTLFYFVVVMDTIDLRYSGAMLVSKYVIYVIVFRLRTIVFYKTREYYYRQFVFPRVGKKYREEGKGKNM